MTWTYSGDPSTDGKDAVRFLSGDTDSTDQLVEDEEIAWTLTQQSNLYLAAALVCEHLATRFARQADKRIGSLSISASQRSKQFAALAAELRSSPNALSLAEVFVGGLTRSGNETLAADTDAVQPFASRGAFDNPEADSDPSQRWAED